MESLYWRGVSHVQYHTIYVGALSSLNGILGPVKKGNNYYARVIIIECKNKRFAANIIHLFVEARRAETNKWFITNERSELK